MVEKFNPGILKEYETAFADYIGRFERSLPYNRINQVGLNEMVEKVAVMYGDVGQRTIDGTDDHFDTEISLGFNDLGISFANSNGNNLKFSDGTPVLFIAQPRKNEPLCIDMAVLQQRYAGFFNNSDGITYIRSPFLTVNRIPGTHLTTNLVNPLRFQPGMLKMDGRSTRYSIVPMVRR